MGTPLHGAIAPGTAAPEAAVDLSKKDAPAIDRGAEGEQSDSAVTTARRKEFAGLQARYALAGYLLHRLAGREILTRWGLSRVFCDDEAATEFLRKIGRAT